MQNSLSVDEAYGLCILLFQARHAIFKTREIEVNEFGVTAIQAGILIVIQTIGDEATPAEISRWMFRRPATITGILNGMEKAGLVRKVKNLHRKDLVRVMLTEKGRQVYHQVNKRTSALDVMSALSEEERQQLVSCLEKILNKALKTLGISREKVRSMLDTVTSKGVSATTSSGVGKVFSSGH